MEGGKEQGMLVVTRLMAHQNPLEQLQAKFKEVENGFRAWLDKQSMPVEAAAVTATGAVQGAAIGALMGTLTKDVSSSFPTPPQASLNHQAMASLKQAQALSGGPWVQARNFAVMTGVNAGLACVMKRLRGKEDVQSRWTLLIPWILLVQSEYDMLTHADSTIVFHCVLLFDYAVLQNRLCTESHRNPVEMGRKSLSFFKGQISLSLQMLWSNRFFQTMEVLRMVAAFGSGAMFSLVSGMGGAKQAANAVTSGLFFALIQGVLFQFGQKLSQPPVEDMYYSRTRSMLNSLGLQNYEKNFKKGFALRDVKIPPGPRLLILDHRPKIEREVRKPWVKFDHQSQFIIRGVFIYLGNYREVGRGYRRKERKQPIPNAIDARVRKWAKKVGGEMDEEATVTVQFPGGKGKYGNIPLFVFIK
ncbi:hypothetical protein CXB51_022752 [Gossypium anomalum]|uniref:Uncharacterized protein n=1 Tax=Gossypium anomalum TaxID=47600 RepID=A0A8J6CVV0_9ROSI|nr:hypothetical protein CXB51_022752 [Gossypium anomalum]